MSGHLRLETSIPAASLESILCTEELLRRQWRPPDHEKETSALAAMVCALAASPRTILQTLADKVLDLLQADSAGLSLLTKDETRFYWPAIAGAWRPHIGGGTPRDFGPCGDVLDRNIPMLFTHWERRYPYLNMATPFADEGLLVPFYVNGKAVGTIWAIAHSGRRKFDAEDLRLLESMGRFASAAYQTVQAIEDQKLEFAAREKAEMELRELTDGLEARLASIVASSDDAIIGKNLDGIITSWNKGAERLFGYTAEEVVGKPVTILIPPDQHNEERMILERIGRGERIEHYETARKRKDGSSIVISLTVSPVKNVEGRIVGASKIARDITKQKLAEARESELMAELAFMNRAATLGELSASIAHELNQPLTGIVTRASAARRWLARESPDIDKARAALDQIEAAGHRASDIITSVKSMFKKDVRSKAEVDINKLIWTVMGLVSVDLRKHEIELKMELNNQLPPVLANQIQLQQVVLNLVMNATDAMHSVRPRVLSAKSKLSGRDSVHVSIADTGIGIDPANVDEIFKPLFTTKEHGMGMGLSICRSIIENHGGRIWASPGAPSGTIVQFELPTN